MPPRTSTADSRTTGLTTPGLRSRAVRGRIALRRPTAKWRPLPEFFVIGTQRGGTTSLYNYLAGHPQVRAPLVKEAQYFTYRHQMGLEWYRTLLPLRRADSLQQTFDATPYYLYHPLAPERLAAVLPTARMIALLRDPVERAYSHHRHSQRLGLEDRSFEDALRLEPERLAGEEERIRTDPSYLGAAHRHYSYVARGRYAEQLRRWFAVFPREQFHILRSEDLFAAPETSYAEVLRFLGLPAYHPPRFEVFTKSSRDSGPSAQTRERLAADFAGPNSELEALLGPRMVWGD